jgi:hypothetical protein
MNDDARNREREDFHAKQFCIMEDAEVLATFIQRLIQTLFNIQKVVLKFYGSKEPVDPNVSATGQGVYSSSKSTKIILIFDVQYGTYTFRL